MDQSTVDKSARIAADVRALVHDGRLSEGALLPSTRALARDLGVARGTVIRAYEQLDGEGYIELRHGSRPRVTTTVDRGLAAPRPTEAPRGERAGPDEASVDLLPGVPAISAVSDRDWRAAWHHAARQPLADAYPPRQGERVLRDAITSHLTLVRGFAPESDRVVVTAGTSEAVSLIVEATGPVRVAVENPGYVSGKAAIASAGGDCVPIGVDDRGIMLEELAAAHRRSPIGVVLVTPSHQFPTGVVMPVARRIELLRWAADNDVLVVEDDYDSEFRHTGSPLPALASIDSAGVVLHVGSFSKILNPQLRCGYVVLPPRGGSTAAESVLAAREARGASVASVVQIAVAHLIASGALRRHIARCRRDYRHKRQLVERAFVGRDGLRVGALDGGLHVVVEFERPAASAVVASARRRGVVIADLQHYVAAGSGLELNGIVIGYGAVSATALATALTVIDEALQAP